MLDDCIIGTLLVPNKDTPQKNRLSLSYYLTRDRVIFEESAQHLADIAALLSEVRHIHGDSPAYFFYELMEFLIQDDMVYLQNYEKRLSALEDLILNHPAKSLPPLLLNARRNLLFLNSYYLQVMDMTDVMLEDPNHFFTDDELRFMNTFSQRIDRLYDHTQILREYALQIREMHQTQMDSRQNETVQILTVLTTLFFPLSLVTGWYGMNFANMPELHSPYAYFILIGVCALIIVLEIWYFKKKEWI